MRTLNLTVLDTSGGRSDLDFPVARILDAGFTGKNREGAMKHVEELKAHGVAAPDRIPAYFAVTREMVTTDDEIEVLGDDTSGEVEVVFLFKGDQVYIAVGSDHTDRELEKDSIPKSKVICPKVVSRDVWRLADVKPHWERLKLQSWVEADGGRTLYQEGSLADFLTVDDFLDGVRSVVDGRIAGRHGAVHGDHPHPGRRAAVLAHVRGPPFR